MLELEVARNFIENFILTGTDTLQQYLLLAIPAIKCH